MRVMPCRGPTVSTKIQLSRTSGTLKIAIRRAVSLSLNWSAIFFNNLRIRGVEWLLQTPRPAGHAIPPFREHACIHLRGTAFKLFLAMQRIAPTCLVRGTLPVSEYRPERRRSSGSYDDTTESRLPLSPGVA